MIDIDISRKLGGFDLSVAFRSEGQVTALFGRSGAGKSSVVKAIAGLVTPERGHIRIGGDTLFDSAKRINVGVERRRAGVVFQDGRLFPHLRVKDNLLYGFQRARGARPIQPDGVIEVLGIGNLLDRYPAKLSGGERQRVALGRALLMQPRILLMDEPLASLDAERKAEVLPYFGMLASRFGIPIVYVTHDADEVFELAHHLVLIRDGAVTASGPLVEITGRLDLPPGAEALGFGAVIEGVVDAHDAARGLTFIATRAGRFAVPRNSQSVGSPATLRVAARDVALATARPEGISIQNIFEVEVDELHRTAASTVRIALRAGEGRLVSEVTEDSVARLQIETGARVFALVKAAALVRTGLAD